MEIGEIKDDVMTLADQLIAEGRQEGEKAILQRLLTLCPSCSLLFPGGGKIGDFFKAKDFY